ncbi:unnamed protein product [Heligmosomoides polygyrus]|uniref:Secreted protein n=1 Tax=Heligmosomoides polygyrus TaxID=6339 RepID=A0A3P7YR61_HELPZ|nr:unnamed protein product [Heligmosomoides polygyrus]
MHFAVLLSVASVALAQYASKPSGYGGNNGQQVQNMANKSPTNKPVDYTKPMDNQAAAVGGSTNQKNSGQTAQHAEGSSQKGGGQTSTKEHGPGQSSGHVQSTPQVGAIHTAVASSPSSGQENKQAEAGAGYNPFKNAPALGGNGNIAGKSPTNKPVNYAKPMDNQPAAVGSSTKQQNSYQTAQQAEGSSEKGDDQTNIKPHNPGQSGGQVQSSPQVGAIHTAVGSSPSSGQGNKQGGGQTNTKQHGSGQSSGQESPTNKPVNYAKPMDNQPAAVGSSTNQQNSGQTAQHAEGSSQKGGGQTSTKQHGPGQSSGQVHSSLQVGASHTAVGSSPSSSQGNKQSPPNKFVDYTKTATGNLGPNDRR